MKFNAHKGAVARFREPAIAQPPHEAMRLTGREESVLTNSEQHFPELSPGY